VEDAPELVVRDAAHWRAWLAKHHDSSVGIWLVLAKKTTVQPTSLNHTQALEEALCHGWIDGQLRGRDADTYLTGKPNIERDVSSHASRPLPVSICPGVVPARHGNTNLRANEAAFDWASVLSLQRQRCIRSRLDNGVLEPAQNSDGTVRRIGRPFQTGQSGNPGGAQDVP
jgi:hypothetical protein